MSKAEKIARETFANFTSLYDVDTEHDVKLFAAALESYAREERLKEQQRILQAVRDSFTKDEILVLCRAARIREVNNG